MKVILLKDVNKLGKKFDVKDISSGYARNFLLPNGFAIIADKESLKNLENQKEIELKNAEKRKIENKKIIEALENKEIKIEANVGDEGQLFESINEKKISEKLKELGFDIDKSNIEIDEPIKHKGEHLAKIKLDDMETNIKIII